MDNQYKQYAYSFKGAQFLRSPQLSVLGEEQFKDGRPLKCFSECTQVRPKCAEKDSIVLWGMFTASMGSYRRCDRARVLQVV